MTVNPTRTSLSDQALQKLVMRAKEDLGKRLVLNVDQIEVVEAQAVEWRDTSLGCPQPGMMYAQVITPGYRIVLEAKGQTYEYHTDRGQVVVLCDDENGPAKVTKGEPVKSLPTAPSPQNPYLQRMVALAKEDLAGRLVIEVDRIDLLAVKEVTWPDASLGCPQPEMRYKQVPQDGLLIRLAVEGQVYEYHSGGSRDPFLCEQPAKVPPQSDGLRPPPGSADD